MKIAKSCLKDLAQDLNEISATDGKNKIYQILTFKWGVYPLNIIDTGSYVTVRIHIEVQKEVREKLSTLPDEVREQYRIAIFQELLSNHRTGSSWQPANLTDIKQLEGFDLVQYIHLTDGALSCNRLVDGIQECVSVAFRVVSVLNLGLGMSAMTNQPIKPAPDIYI